MHRLATSSERLVRPRAFTLLEVLVATGLLSAVLTTAFLLFHAGARGATMGMAQDSTLESMAQLIEQLRTDLEQMVIVPGRSPRDSVRITPDGQRLAFLVVDRGLTPFITPRALAGRPSRVTTGPQDLASLPQSAPFQTGGGPGGPGGQGQSSAGQGATGQPTAGQSGTGQSGVGQSGTGQSGVGQSGTGQFGAGQDGTRPSAAGQTGTAGSATAGGAGASGGPTASGSAPTTGAQSLGSTTSPAPEAWAIFGRPVLYRPAPRPDGLFSPARNGQVMGAVVLSAWRFALSTSIEDIEGSLARGQATSAATTAAGLSDERLVTGLLAPPSLPGGPLSGRSNAGTSFSRPRVVRASLTASYIDPRTGQRVGRSSQDTVSTTLAGPGPGQGPSTTSTGADVPTTGETLSGQWRPVKGLFLVIRMVAVDGEHRAAERRTLIWDLETARLASAFADRYPLPPDTIHVLGPRGDVRSPDPTGLP